MARGDSSHTLRVVCVVRRFYWTQDFVFLGNNSFTGALDDRVSGMLSDLNDR